MSQPFYASADFTDGDIGSADNSLESIREFINLDEAIENLLVASANKVEEGTDSYINSIREYKRVLQRLCCAENLKLLGDFFDPKTEEKKIKDVYDLATILTNPNFNPSSSDVFRNIIVDISGNSEDAEIKEELGYEYTIVEGAISKINELYLKSLEDLFAADKQLHSALDAVRYTFKNVDSILNLEINESTIEMYGVLAKYIHSTLAKHRLKSHFDSFLKARRKFIKYRVLLNAKNVANIESRVTCSICLDNPVSHVLIGCGHTFCNECTRKHSNICYICRSKIRERVKIYFS
jgi:hypothetical protein